MNSSPLSALVTVIATLAAGAASAASVAPASYDMQNGNSGSFNYWDDKYNGSGNNTADGSTLSGGLGDLTDGVIASKNWNLVEGPRGPNGPYVGWRGIDPVVNFNFASSLLFNSMTFHFDDSNGYGGVSQPGRVMVNGLQQVVSENAGSAPFSFTFDLSGVTTNTLSTTIFRNGGWVFLSEVTFDAAPSPVPVPASLPLLAAGLGGLGFMAWRKRKAA